MKHTYYRITLELKSPLSIGSGENVTTDKDIIKDSYGNPYIPATSIAGALRHFINNESKRDKLFGNIKNGHRENSAVILYDAELDSSNTVSVRDCVKLENKVAVDGAKFDFQIVETGARFVFYMELDKNNEQYTADVEKMISAISSSVIRFGQKTSRGYGITEVVSVKKVQFDFDNKEEIDAFLNFDVTEKESWENISELKIDDFTGNTDVIKIKLKQKGAISIREYTTQPSQDKNTEPDYKHITLSDGTAVIPGTSWAGAFRERFNEFAGIQRTNEFFGYVNDKTGDTQCSNITFSESKIQGNINKKITRNSIDRFSSKTLDSALYTEYTCYNGSCELIITMSKDTDKINRNILSAVLFDLSKGLLAIGGLTSVGRGIFEIEKIYFNNEDRTTFIEKCDVKNLLAEK